MKLVMPGRRWLVEPLGRYDEYDEFQVGRMLVNIVHASGGDREAAIEHAERRFGALLEQLPDVIALAHGKRASDGPVECFGIWIHPDGSVDFHCVFTDEACDDASVMVHGDNDGRLRVR